MSHHTYTPMLEMRAPVSRKKSNSLLPQSSLQPSQQRRQNGGTHEEHLEEKVRMVVDDRMQAIRERLEVLELKVANTHDMTPVNAIVEREGSGIEDTRTYSRLETEEQMFEAQHSHLHSLTHEMRYQIQESVWEAVVLVGQPVFGSAGSIFMIVCMLLNFFAQAFLCFIVGIGFTEYPYPSLSSVDRWRMTAGHDVRTADITTGTSLVSRVCQNDGSLAIASRQQTMLNEIRQYTTGPLESFTTLSVGPLLCMFAIFVWTLTLFKEFRAIIVFSWSMEDHVGDRTLVTWSGKHFVLNSISRQRFVFLSCVNFLRVTIAVGLLLSGSMWLAQTKSIQLLVLNTSALNFILDVDEVMYAALAPHPAKVLLRSTQSISHPKLWFWKGLGSSSVLNSLGSIAYVLVFSLLVVWPGMEGMEAIEEALCRGDQDFVYGVQASTGLMYTSYAQPFNQSLEDLAESSFKEETIRAIIRGADPRNITGTSYTTWSSLGFKMDQSMAEYVNMWSVCQDWPPPWPATVKFAMQSSTGLPHATSCQDLQTKCMDEEQRLLRLICPETCGCATPRSGLLLSSNTDGCPREACRATKSYREALEELPCKDMSAEELAHSNAWTLYFNQFETFWASQFPDAMAMTSEIFTGFRRDGCKGVVADYIDNLCSEGLAFQSIRPFCPETCGCSVSDFVNCPLSCSRSDVGQ